MEKILYVEDQEDIQEIAKLALVNLGGYNVKICSSGEEALKEMESFNPDLFLLDVMMPNMDGPQTLCEIRKNTAFAKTPVIFMTAKVQPEEISEYIALGIVGVINKPFDPMTLANEIRELWEKSQN